MEFNIGDVARIHGLVPIRAPKGSEIFCECPFCGDRRGKFSYILNKGDKKNIYKCFACDEGGNMFDLHVRLSGKTFGSSSEIAKDIYQQLEGGEVPASSPKKEFVPAVTESKRATNEEISACYYALLKELTLKEEHHLDLIRRGLDDETIARYRFKSVPTYKEARAICETLYRKHIKMEGVPGFYRNGKRWALWLPGKGYFCPVFDGDKNLILGFQIRLDTPLDGTKYLWLSSAGKDGGVGSGAIPTLLPGRHRECIIVTEGILKATIIYSMLRGQITVVGVPGIKSLDSLGMALKRFESNSYVIEAFDMDKMMTSELSDLNKKRLAEGLDWDKIPSKKDNPYHKLLVQHRIMLSADKLREYILENFDLYSHPMKWDCDGEFWKGNFKGLDDFLLDNEEYINPMIDYLLNLAHEDEEIRKMA